MAFLRSTTIGARRPPQASAETEIFSTASLTFCCTSGRIRVITIPSLVFSTCAVRVFRTNFMADHYGCFTEKFNRDDFGRDNGNLAATEPGLLKPSQTMELLLQT